MHGTFRTDVELEHDRRQPGAFRLRRRWSARAVWLAMIGLGWAFVAADFARNRPLVAVLTLLLSLVILVLHLRAELDSWSFEGDEAVRRSLQLPGFRIREERLPARLIQRVGLARRGRKARVWLETDSGEQYALVEGDEARVSRIAESFERAVTFAKAESPSSAVH